MGWLAMTLAVGPIGCASDSKFAPPPPAPPPPGYIVGAPDQLQIVVLPDPIITRDVRVRPDGKISVDLIGDVRAAGRTPTEIAAAIQEKISKFKRDADVTVSVLTSPSQFVTIFGEVRRPGTFPLDTETRVSEAIGIVGGPMPFASLNNVHIVRTDRRSKTEVIDIYLKDIQNGNLATNIIVEEGDLIIVPPTWLARIGYVMQMIFFPFQPLLGVAGSVGGAAAGGQAVGAF